MGTVQIQTHITGINLLIFLKCTRQNQFQVRVVQFLKFAPFVVCHGPGLVITSYDPGFNVPIFLLPENARYHEVHPAGIFLVNYLRTQPWNVERHGFVRLSDAARGVDGLSDSHLYGE